MASKYKVGEFVTLPSRNGDVDVEVIGVDGDIAHLKFGDQVRGFQFEAIDRHAKTAMERRMEKAPETPRQRSPSLPARDEGGPSDPIEAFHERMGATRSAPRGPAGIDSPAVGMPMDKPASPRSPPDVPGQPGLEQGYVGNQPPAVTTDTRAADPLHEAPGVPWGADVRLGATRDVAPYPARPTSPSTIGGPDAAPTADEKRPKTDIPKGMQANITALRAQIDRIEGNMPSMDADARTIMQGRVAGLRKDLERMEASVATKPDEAPTSTAVSETSSDLPGLTRRGVLGMDARGRADIGEGIAMADGSVVPRAEPVTPAAASNGSAAASPSSPADVVADAVTPEPGDKAGGVLAQGALDLGATRPEDGPLSFSEAKKESRKIEKTYMESWVENSAPKMVEKLVARGMLSEASAIQTFAKQQQFQNGVERYASAAIMAARGDMDGFADEMTILFDDERYNPDGFTVDRKSSQWLRDEAGEITGAELTFVSEDGDKVTERWDSMTAMVEEMLTAMSPEAAMQRHLDGITAGRDARSGAATRSAELADKITLEVVKAGLKDTDTAKADVDDALEALSKDFSFNALPADEKMQAVMDYLDTRDTAVSMRQGGVRPTAASAPEPLRY